jgi:fructokinase
VIVVAGEALIDRIESPDGRVADVPGGGPYNVARTIARLGSRVAFLGRLSTDDPGVLLRSQLVADGVDISLVVSTDDPTSVALARVDADGVATYVFRLHGSAAAGLVLDDVPGGLPPDTAALHVGTLGLVIEPMAAAIESLVGSTGSDILVVLDPNCRPSAIEDRRAYVERIDRILARADIVKASVEDLAYLRPGVPPTQAAREFLRLGPRAVLVTDGPQPLRIVSPDSIDELPIPRVSVVDTVGAGDAFGGGFLAAWIGAGRRRKDAGDRAALMTASGYAIAVAALTTTRAGAEPPSAAQVARLLAR